MSFKLRNLKYVDNKTKHLIFGYSKQAKEILSTCNLFQTIPHLIISLCTLYYFETDKFKSNHFTLLNDGKTFRNFSRNCCNGITPFVVGQEILSTHIPLTCTWRIKIDDLTCQGSFMLIGVVALTKKQANIQPDLHSDPIGCLYGLFGQTNRSFKWCADWTVIEYGEPFMTGDLIDMHVNITKTKQQLLFSRNGKNLGTAFDNLKFGNNICYRLKVYVSEYGGQLTLIDFKTH